MCQFFILVILCYSVISFYSIETPIKFNSIHFKLWQTFISAYCSLITIKASRLGLDTQCRLPLNGKKNISLTKCDSYIDINHRDTAFTPGHQGYILRQTVSNSCTLDLDIFAKEQNYMTFKSDYKTNSKSFLLMFFVGFCVSCIFNSLVNGKLRWYFQVPLVLDVKF